MSGIIRVNYKQELSKLKNHREKYFPVMTGLVRMYDTLKDSDFPVEIINAEEMMFILELIDIGYLDAEAFVIKKDFGDITGLFYNGEYPLTESGEYTYKEKRLKNNSIFIILILTLIFVVFLIFVIFLNKILPDYK